MDTFGFQVGGRSPAQQAILQHRLPKVAFFGVKNAVFQPKTHFSETSSKKIVTIVTGHQKHNIFVLTHCMAGLWGGRQGPFLAQNLPPKLSFFTQHPYSPHFWGSDGPDSMES